MMDWNDITKAQPSEAQNIVAAYHSADDELSIFTGIASLDNGKWYCHTGKYNFGIYFWLPIEDLEDGLNAPFPYSHINTIIP